MNYPAYGNPLDHERAVLELGERVASSYDTPYAIWARLQWATGELIDPLLYLRWGLAATYATRP